MKLYNARPVSLTIEVLVLKILFFSTTEVFTCSKVINAFKWENSWTDLFRKSATSFSLILLTHSSQNMHDALEDFYMLSVTSRFSSPVSKVFAIAVLMSVRPSNHFYCTRSFVWEPKGLGSIPAISFLSLFYKALLWRGGIWFWLFLRLFKKVK